MYYRYSNNHCIYSKIWTFYKIKKEIFELIFLKRVVIFFSEIVLKKKRYKKKIKKIELFLKNKKIKIIKKKVI
jgi:hypothetical protein